MMITLRKQRRSNDNDINKLLATKNLVNSRQTAFYDSDRQSTLYYLKPSTSSIYLFNLEKNEFVAESLKYTGPP